MFRIPETLVLRSHSGRYRSLRLPKAALRLLWLVAFGVSILCLENAMLEEIKTNAQLTRRAITAIALLSDRIDASDEIQEQLASALYVLNSIQRQSDFEPQ